MFKYSEKPYRIMAQWDQLASDSSIEKTVSALKANGIEAMVVNNREEAKEEVFKIIPEGAEVMTMTSRTADETGVTDEIMESGRFKPARKAFASLDKKEQRRLGAAPDWTIGSVHAVTEDGKVIVASATGSQLPAYAYGAEKVLWIVGAQKITKNVDEGMRRIEQYVFPLEDERAKKAYGVGSGINKLLIFNREFAPGRIKMILVKENLGF